MILRQTAVSELTREYVVENDDTMPADIVAVFQGSGVLAAGFDATGMQGLNFRIGQYAETASVTHPDMLIRDNLHLYHSDALSRHYRQARHHSSEIHPDWVPMPLGWLEYDLVIDGRRFDTAAIRQNAKQWQRRFSPRKGLLETSYRLGPCTITWRSNIAPDSYAYDFSFGARSEDGREHEVAVVLLCHQTLRDGQPLATGGFYDELAEDFIYRAWAASDTTSTEKVKDTVTIAWTLTCDQPAEAHAHDAHLQLTWSDKGAELTAGFRIICGTDRKNTHTREYAREQVAAFKKQKAEQALIDAAEKWNDYFDAGAEFWNGEPDKEFLTLQQQYVLRAGQSWHNGLFSGNIWGQRFMGRTFWDAFFMCDGMLRCGHIGKVREFADWLVRTMLPEGRPHMWMTYWDGTPGTLADTAAWFVNLNFAAVQIRLYSYSKDNDDLEKRAFPYLHRVAHFVFDEVMAKEDGRWELHGLTAGDIGKGHIAARTQRGILAFTVWVLGKCAEYAAELGRSDETIERCCEVISFYRKNPISLRQPGMWDMRIPYMADVEPIADLSTWWEYARELFEGMATATYKLMPWWAASAATSLSTAGTLALQDAAGSTELALRCQDDALDYVCGMGYFNERLYEQQIGGYAPFLPASGAWLSSIATMFAHGSSWNDVVHVAVGLPKRWRYQRLKWRGIHTPNGAKVSGTYRPFYAKYQIENQHPCTIRARIPARLEGDCLAVTVDGEKTDARAEHDQVINVEVGPGVHTVTIQRDVTTPTDVLLVEPFEHGRELAGLLRDAGLSVRWLREYDAVGELADKAKAIVLDVSWSAVPGEVTKAIRLAVENGTAFVGMCHAAMESQDRAMAGLVGVYAQCTEPWQFDETLRSYHLTDAGRDRLPGLPPAMQVPATQVYTTQPEPEVEVLATEEGRNEPVITRRPVGSGTAWWLAPGNKMSNRHVPKNSTRDVILYGDSAVHYADRSWLKVKDFRQIFAAVVAAAVADANQN